MSIISAIGVVLLILLGVVLVCLAAICLEKRFPGKSHDERQGQSQGRAYRLSFGVGLFYYGFVTVLLMAQQKLGQTIEPYLLVFGGIILQAVVYHTYCMIKQSFMTLSQKPIRMVIRYLIMGIIASLFYRVSVRWDLLEEMGYPPTFEWIFLALAVMSFFFALCYLCQLLYQRLRREKE